MSQQNTHRTPVLTPSAPLQCSRDREAYQDLFKRVMDLFGSSLLICLLSPVLALVAFLVWVNDGTPIFYRRRVVGPQGEFDAFKFRTMCRDADAVLAADAELLRAFSRDFKLKSDPRVTRVGAWLRKYSLDELPQLVNVLKGEMSLVGPRMITRQELSRYGQFQDLLLSIRPGITGYWQVRGRQDVSYKERVRMDVFYITHWKLRLDLMILLRTPLRVIRGEGAY